MYEVLGHPLIERESNLDLPPEQQQPESVVLAVVSYKDTAIRWTRNGFLTLADGTQCVVTGWRELAIPPDPRATDPVKDLSRPQLVAEHRDEVELMKDKEEAEEVDAEIVPPKDIPRKSEF